MVYQMMFAIITPALISGAFAERMKFTAYVVVHPALGDAGLRPDGALGLGRRRLAARAWARSTSPAAPSSTSAPGVSALVLRAGDGQAARLSRRGDAPAQPDDDAAGHRAALVRLVRLQRRQRPGAPTAWPSAPSSTTNTAGGRGGAGLDVHRVAAPRQADRPGRLLPARWPAWSAITPAAGFVAPCGARSIGVVARVVCYGAVHAQAQARLRRLAGHLRRPRRRRQLRARSLTGVFASRRSTAPAPTACSTATRASSVIQLIGVAATLVYAAW